MAHVSGNATWVDYPSTATLVTAATLEAVEGAIDSRPRGIVGRRTRTTDATTTSAGTERMVLWVAASVVSGRTYKVSGLSLGVYGAAANGYASVNLRYTTDGTTVPSTSSPQLAQTVTAMPIAFAGYGFDITGLYTPGSNQSLRIGLSYGGSAGNNATMQGGVPYPIVVAIEDLGIDPGASGADL